VSAGSGPNKLSIPCSSPRSRDRVSAQGAPAVSPCSVRVPWTSDDGPDRVGRGAHSAHARRPWGRAAAVQRL